MRSDHGVLIGLVTSLDDPENLGRVKVKFPTLGDQESDWARLATLMAGPERGVFFCPEVGDEVIVALECNDLRRPYILGGLWSQTDKPPRNDGNKTKNNWRFIRSRSGHLIKLDDTQGQERIEIFDKDGQRKVIIDSANQKIQVVCDSGDVEVKAASGKVKIEAPTIEIKASGNLNLEAGGTLTIKGATVNIN